MRKVQKLMKENWFSFSVAFDSQFSCQCVFKCTEINSVSAVKHNCLILLLELHIRMQLSLNTSVSILLSSCGHFLTISHIVKHTELCEGLKPHWSQMSHHEKQLCFLKDLFPLVLSLKLHRKQNKKHSSGSFEVHQSFEIENQKKKKTDERYCHASFLFYGLLFACVLILALDNKFFNLLLFGFPL